MLPSSNSHDSLRTGTLTDLGEAESGHELASLEIAGGAADRLANVGDVVAVLVVQVQPLDDRAQTLPGRLQTDARATSKRPPDEQKDQALIRHNSFRGLIIQQLPKNKQ